MLWRKLKKVTSAAISQSEQSLYENKFPYRCLWAFRKTATGLFIAKFLLASGRHICVPQGDTNTRSPYILLNLSKTLRLISSARNITQTWIFARLFEYSSSFTSLIVDFICCIVLMFVWQRKSAISWQKESSYMYSQISCALSSRDSSLCNTLSIFSTDYFCW